MITRATIISLTFLICPAFAVQYVYDVTVLPPTPTDADNISITVDGWWGNAFAPKASRHIISDYDIFFDAGGALPVGPAIPSYWNFTEILGSLPAGEYDLYASIYLGGTNNPWSDLYWGPELQTSFTIVPEPTSFVIALGFGTILLTARGNQSNADVIKGL